MYELNASDLGRGEGPLQQLSPGGARKSEGPLDHLPVLLVEVRIIRQQLSTSCVGVGIFFFFWNGWGFFSPNKEEMWRQERGEEEEGEGEQTPVAVRCHSHSQPCVSSSRGVTRLIKPTIMTQTRDEPRQRRRFSLWCLFYNKKSAGCWFDTRPHLHDKE